MFRFLRCHTKTLYQNVVVEFLDGSKNTFIVNARVKGSDLIVEVCRYLHLKETEYFGLQRVDSKTGKMHWINEFRSIRSQVSDDQLLYLKIRFYPPALNSILDDQETIQQFYLQSLLNVVRGDFKVPSSSICLATSYIAQAQLGDHDETQSYAELLQNAELTPELTLKIKDLHQSIKGTPKDICQIRFLEMLLSCPLFGVKLHKAVNDKNEDCYIGINSKAEFLLVMSDLIILRFPEWPKIKLQCKFPINRFRKQTSELDVLLQYEHDKFITSHSIVDDLVDQYKFCVSRSALMAPFR
ncbi:hypothetical protein FQA39_LY00049 [Lamprigera yunnana]|nr:hypothetical protein FQA39_LY00049 [Lamprigera yunnana]